MISPSFDFFSLSDLVIIVLIAIFLLWIFLKKYIFLISSFNIKLVGGWASRLSSNLEFHRLWF